jgi:hypothetical protein
VYAPFFAMVIVALGCALITGLVELSNNFFAGCRIRDVKLERQVPAH